MKYVKTLIYLYVFWGEPNKLQDKFGSASIQDEQSKQWIKGNLVNFICEAKSVSKKDVLIEITCSLKVVQWPETMLSKLAIFSLYSLSRQSLHEFRCSFAQSQYYCSIINPATCETK